MTARVTTRDNFDRPTEPCVRLEQDAPDSQQVVILSLEQLKAIIDWMTEEARSPSRDFPWQPKG